jgi:hypothetical protein
MVNQRLTHDCAEAMARTLLDMVKPCLREENRLHARAWRLIVVKQRRLNPTKN